MGNGPKRASTRRASWSPAPGLLVQPAHSFQEQFGGRFTFPFGQDALGRPQEGELAVMEPDEPERHLADVALVGRRPRGPRHLPLDDTERPLARVSPADQKQSRLATVGKYTQ